MPCCSALLTSASALLTMFFGCWPSFFAASDSGVLSPQPAQKNAEAAATISARSVLRLVDKPVFPDPGHHLAQPAAHLLDRQLGGLAAARQQRRRARAVLEHELLRVVARLDAAE